jgi:SAM-dependent methyltransferase
MSHSRTSLSISVRRHFVDQFFFFHSDLFGRGLKIIDIGGKKGNKRGLFDIGRYDAEVTYVNIEKKDDPDILADASNIPVPDDSYDIAIAGELLEHVPDPILVLKEAHRLLKPGGKLIATVPFLYPIHADPHDFGRYTENFWENASMKTGFKDVKVERQGALSAVMALALQHFFIAKKISLRPIQIPLVYLLMWLDKRTTNPRLRAWTTGYGLIFHK